MSSLESGTTQKVRNNERVLMDITSASASALAAASASGSGMAGLEREQATKALLGSKMGEVEGGDGGHGNVARSSSTESDETPASGESEDVENENPLLMSDISRMMETMHSKNLMLKKLVRMQQKRLEFLKTENEELRRDGKRKDARLRNADVTVEYLQREVEEQRGMLQRKSTNRVVMEDDSHAGRKSGNKQRGGGANDDSGEGRDGAGKTSSMKRTSCNSGGKRCVHFSARWAVERMMRKLSGMKGSTKGVTMCLCTLGGAMLLRSLVHLMDRNSDSSDS